MINITKQGNNVIVTSDNPKAFNISNGELSVPLNSIYYVLDDESDFIQFNSIDEKGEILFNGVIGDIQVNGSVVTRDNIQMELDNVFNSAGASGEGGTAGVLSINGYDGYVNIKSINGESLIGSGDITIEGGSSGTAGVESIDTGGIYFKGKLSISTSEESGDNSWRVGLNGDMYDSTTNDYYGEGGSMIFGVKSSDNSILVSDGGSLADLRVKVNEWVGTQSEYDALGSYDSGCTYYITE